MASGSGSATNWLKRVQSQTDFFDVLSEEMAGDLSYQEMYTEFVNKFVVQENSVGLERKMYYLDTQTIENAYNSLTSLELGDQG